MLEKFDREICTSASISRHRFSPLSCLYGAFVAIGPEGVCIGGVVSVCRFQVFTSNAQMAQASACFEGPIRKSLSFLLKGGDQADPWIRRRRVAGRGGALRRLAGDCAGAVRHG